MEAIEEVREVKSQKVYIVDDDAAVRQALTPKARGPKARLDSQEEELQRLRRDNARLADALSKAELIIEVQKKVGSLLGWNLPKTDPEGNS